MIVYSVALYPGHLHEVCEQVNHEFPGCAVTLSDSGPTLVEGPRVRRRRMTNVYLRTDVRGHQAMGIRWANTGTHGGHQYEMSASWTEHGWWMARVFELDPSAQIRGGVLYASADDFHEQTNGRFNDPRTPRERQIKRVADIVDRRALAS